MRTAIFFGFLYAIFQSTGGFEVQSSKWNFNTNQIDNEEKIITFFMHIIAVIFVSTIVSGIIVIIKKIFRVHKNNWSTVIAHTAFLMTVGSSIGSYYRKLTFEQNVFNRTGGYEGVNHEGFLTTFSILALISVLLTIFLIYKTRTTNQVVGELTDKQEKIKSEKRLKDKLENY